MQNGEAEADINCLFYASFCARDLPCIISYISHNNPAGHGLQPHLTHAKIEGLKKLRKVPRSQSWQGRKRGLKQNQLDFKVLHVVTGHESSASVLITG